MIDYRQRSTTPEWMDDATVAGPDTFATLRHIAHVNRFLGGARATLRALAHGIEPGHKAPISILDIGAGAADIPVAMVRWARARGLDLHIVAVDFNPAICAWTRERVADFAEIEVVEADVFALPYPPESFDVVHCAMFLHHFPQAQAATILEIMYGLCRRRLIVNDLHRHPLAFHTITWISRLLPCSAMFRHDAPVSVLRGFQLPDWEELARLSGIDTLRVDWHWPFRYVATARKATPHGR